MLAHLLAAGLAAAVPQPPAATSVSSATSVTAKDPPPHASPAHRLEEVAHAISAGRLDQARRMLASVTGAGGSGVAVDRAAADLAFAERRNGEALARYHAVLAVEPGNAVVAERAAISALREGNVTEAAQLALLATQSPSVSWRAWNILAVCADVSRDWAAADEAYAKARSLGPDVAEILNNQGWSHLLRGAWSASVPLLEQAAQLEPTSARIANNLELARAGIADDLPSRSSGESDDSWAARLNDAGVMARLSGDHARAVAAFSRAIETSARWFDRAWNNLALARNSAMTETP